MSALLVVEANVSLGQYTEAVNVLKVLGPRSLPCEYIIANVRVARTIGLPLRRHQLVSWSEWQVGLVLYFIAMDMLICSGDSEGMILKGKDSTMNGELTRRQYIVYDIHISVCCSEALETLLVHAA